LPVTPEAAAETKYAPRVVLADDDVLLREGLASLLDRSGFEVVGQAGNGTELLALVRSVRPELAIIDIRMPPTQATEGLRAARVIRDELPGTAIIVLSAHVEVDEAMELLPETITGEARAKLRRKALIRFEISRSPDSANRVIASACRTSTMAVAAVRDEIDIPLSTGAAPADN